MEVTVYDYFVHAKQTPLQFSGDLPCLDVGKKKRPNYLPIEVSDIVFVGIMYWLLQQECVGVKIAREKYCSSHECVFFACQLCKILPGQRYTKSLSTQQRTSLVEQSQQKPDERMHVLQKASMALFGVDLICSIWQIYCNGNV